MSFRRLWDKEQERRHAETIVLDEKKKSATFYRGMRQ